MLTNQADIMKTRHVSISGSIAPAKFYIFLYICIVFL